MPLSRRPHPARLAVAATLSTALTASLVALAPTGSAAADPTPGSPPAPPTASGPTTTAVPGRSDRVTLITGDVVTVTDAGGGRRTASVEPGAGRETVTFSTTEVDGELMVLPSDAVPYVARGVLDDDLFEVSSLVDDGYAGRDSLPLVVAYADPDPTARRAPVTGTRTTRALPSIGGAALTATTAELDDVWRSLTPVSASGSTPGARATNPAPTTLGGFSHVWLDGRVRPSLDHSVPQIGAPAAWAAGFRGKGVEVAVLDTGVDATHPDLADRVTEQRDFSESASGPTDHFGHGTHVASTIAGTGAASGGRLQGVAPEATILSGKVLGDDGSGYDSWIIAGMEWATASGATVVNMSLGGGPTDGSDPLSLAVDRLSAQTGALFVVAAGNEGEEETVGAPGAAPAALTVAAVDRDENLAEFSSRGPRLGDGGLKPEISAPGVDIVAARAAGTTMGTPVDERYTTASGTSMATPHVAGAAALLAQQHPGWDGARLKDALVSSARPNPTLSVWQQGAGRVDLARAVSQSVFASATADFARPTEEGPVTRTVTYRNDGDVPAELALRLDVSDADVAGRTTDAFSAPSAVTVPARGSADVVVTLDTTRLERGRWSGALVASAGDGDVTRTAVGALRPGPRHRVTVRAVDFEGRDTGAPVLTLFGDRPGTDWVQYVSEGDPLQMDVEEGTYLLHALVNQYDPQDQRLGEILDPALTITGDTEIVLDARLTRKVLVQTPQPAQQQTVLSLYAHREFGTGRRVSHGVMEFGENTIWVTPTRAPADGTFEFSTRWQLVRPSALLTVPGLGERPQVNLLPDSPVLPEPTTYDLVAPGPSLAGATGKVAVVRSAGWDDEQVLLRRAAKVGVAGIVVVRPPDYSIRTVFQPTARPAAVPSMVTTAADGDRLVARAQQGRARVTLDLRRTSPYLYDVVTVATGRVPDQVVHVVSPSNSRRITTTYGDMGSGGWADEQRFGWRPWQDYAWNDTRRFVATPSQREEWVSTGDTLWQHRVSHLRDGWAQGPLSSGLSELPTSYPPGRETERWYAPVVRPAAAPGVPSRRVGDRLELRVAEFVDADGHVAVGYDGEQQARLYRDGTLVAELPYGQADVITTPGEARYRLHLATTRRGPEWQWGVRTSTSWSFRSAHTPEAGADLDLLQVQYDVPADADGRVTDRAHTVGLQVRRQDGSSVAGATLAVSSSGDRGTTWSSLPVRRVGDGFQVSVPAGTDPVSLRVDAADRSGSRVQQTVVDAYGRR
ncbi:S8 family serine peptidase [Terracoccus luteus]|uniref:Subtilisin family serine protease n=1 Tax=Terracoccus luteus TaxID=53356 RepID=A0A839PXB1_9MICO|nr:S8 family serine peptidase [Terracoccus luteus]MBB2987364.1 subtilisin family serine protease [Terracoccus luteus]MCP2173015.1 subtilisin family serine protease [Terracoccus luteus]